MREMGFGRRGRGPVDAAVEKAPEADEVRSAADGSQNGQAAHTTNGPATDVAARTTREAPADRAPRGTSETAGDGAARASGKAPPGRARPEPTRPEKAKERAGPKRLAVLRATPTTRFSRPGRDDGEPGAGQGDIPPQRHAEIPTAPAAERPPQEPEAPAARSVAAEPAEPAEPAVPAPGVQDRAEPATEYPPATYVEDREAPTEYPPATYTHERETPAPGYVPGTPATDTEDREAPQTEYPPATYIHERETPAPGYVPGTSATDTEDQEAPQTEYPPATYVDDREEPPAAYPPATYVDDREGRSPGRGPKEPSSRAGDRDAGAPAPKRSWGPSLTIRGVTLGWRSVVAVLVSLAVAFWVVRGLAGPAGQETAQPSGKGGETVAVPKDKPKNRSVVIDGTAIKPAGAVITLNPALAQPGGQVSINGGGFGPGATVDIVLSAKGDTTGASLGSFKTDRSGGLSAGVTIPENVRGGSVIVTAKERFSDRIATAEAVTAAGIGFAKLNKATGKPGDTVAVSARGFAPGEKINVFWGRVSGEPTATLQADGAGSVSQAPIRVGVGGQGNATLVLVGSKSGTTATVQFFMQSLFPEASTEPYALKAAEQLNLSASGFAPDERVLIYINASGGEPAMTARADSQGGIGGVGFKVPFGLSGGQSLVMVGEKSRASVSSGFEVLPYTPSAQASTYGGAPGTSFSFFGKGFAPDEVVLVYLGRSKGSAGELVSAFRVDERGEAGAAGSYQISGGDQGTLNFTLVGRRSGGRATTAVKVSPATGPVDLPERKEYKLPPSLAR